MIGFKPDDQVPVYVRAALSALIEDPRRLSVPLTELLTLVAKSKTCDLVIRMLASGDGSHGHTGAFISASESPSEDPTLLEEAFLTKPGMILGQHTWLIETRIAAGPDSDPSAAIVSLLHELELHAVPAGLLLQELAKAGLGDSDGASLPLVLSYMRRDQHLDLGRQEQYVRAAARFERAIQQDQDLAWLGKDLLRGASLDAIDTFGTSENQAGDNGSEARVRWLGAAVPAIQAGGPDTVITAPKPPARQLRTWVKADGTDALDLMARRVSARVPMPDVLDEARIVAGVTVASVLDQYRKQVVPALLAHGPADLTDEGRKHAFLTYHGVPGLLALRVIEVAGTLQPPSVTVTPAWPPAGMPVFWLNPKEVAQDWSPLAALPQSVQDTAGLKHGDRIWLHGAVYKVAAEDTPPAGPRVRARYFPHKRTGKYVALLRQPASSDM